jgi:hypothetical protein
MNLLLVRLARRFLGSPPETVQITVRNTVLEGVVLSTDPVKGKRVKYTDPADGLPRYIWYNKKETT